MDSSRSYDPSPRQGNYNDRFDSQPSASAGSSGSVSAAAAAALAGLPSLTVLVSVRDVTLSMEVGTGLQTCKWLASTAAAQYAALHPAALGAAAFLPVHLSNLAGTALFPQDIICEKIEQGETVKLELLGPRLGLTSPDFARERSLWELYAYASQVPHALVPVVFLYDASQLVAVTTPPAIFGNFNGWNVPIPMNYWKGNIYKHQMGQSQGRQQAKQASTSK